MSKTYRILRAIKRLASDLRKQEGGRNAISYLKRFKFSHAKAIDISKYLKKIASPIKAFKRHSIRRYISNNTPIIPTSDSSLKLPSHYLSGIDQLVSYYAGLFAAKEERIKAEYEHPYSLVIKCGKVLEDPEEIRPIIEFSKQKKLFEILCRYIGELPVISSVSLMYTEPNENVDQNLQGSQLFHRDMNERRQLHLIVPIWEADMESGPFTFIPSKKSDQVARATHYNCGRLTDEDVFKVVNKDDCISFTGNPGAAFLVNPYRCFHYGARAKSKKRLILIINYTSIFEGAEGQLALYRAQNRNVLDDGCPKTRALLNL